MSSQGQEKQSQEKRSPEEIEADLVRTRQELSASVDELTRALDPRVKLDEVKSSLSDTAQNAVGSAKRGVDDVKAMATSFLKDVKGGDPKSVGIVGAGVGVVAVVVLAGIGARRSKNAGGAVAKYAAWRRERQHRP